MKLLQLGSSLLSTIIPGLFRLGPDIEIAKTQDIKVAVPISIPVDLRPWFNNRAVGADGDFDHHNRHYWASELLPTGAVKIGTVEFTLPSIWDGSPDNVIADGQTLDVPFGVRFAREMQILYAGDFTDGETGAEFIFHFEDGTHQVVEASIHNWWNLHWINAGGAIQTPYHYKPGGGKDYNITQMYTWSTSIKSDSPLVSIRFPYSAWWNRLHIFAMSIGLSDTSTGQEYPHLAFNKILLTTKWKFIDGQKAFAVELQVTNTLPTALSVKPQFWIDSKLSIIYNSTSLETIQAGEVHRLMPGDQVVAKIWVIPPRPTKDGDLRMSFASAPGTLRVADKHGETVHEQYIPHLKGEDDDDKVDPLLRDVPYWWEEAKLGMFMHWGIYSVPGWAPPGPYAEWYWYHQHHEDYDPSSFWTHHLNTYGQDFLYDDFIPEVGLQFNASEIVRIVAASGAKYFIPTTMHHDGFCIFDSKNATRRSSVHLGPKRDFLRELFDAAKKEQPHLRRGTYFSMVEWYNPNVGDGGYGWGTWPGWLARNAYNTSKAEPYTGALEVEDWLRDEQLAKMRILAEDYETEIMWCDIGGPNMTRTFLESWLPFADKENLQVAMNNRCGVLPQFDTPEYAKFSSIQYTKWESTESVDPHSFGYNRVTSPLDYRSPHYLLHTLIDIVSKNGNYLLNIGPDGDGVIPQPVVERLLAMGHWLGHSGECIYGTQPFYPGAEAKSLRFTRTLTTFCIISLERPQDELVIINAHVPILKNDTISLLGAGDLGENLQWANLGGTYVIKVPEAALDKVHYAWAFQVKYA